MCKTAAIESWTHLIRADQFSHVGVDQWQREL